ADPKSDEAHINLGVALGKSDVLAAERAFRRAVELAPKSAVAHSNLGVSLQYQGDLDGAIAEFRTALALRPSYAGAHDNLLNAMNYHPRLPATEVFEEHRTWGRRHAD